MMKQVFSFVFLLTFISPAMAQEDYPGERPKLVVGIVVDQMRYEYLTRYWDRYGEGGFKRLVKQGFNFKNHHFNYIPTATGPGHTSVYTGSTPSEHGIIGNEWFDVFTDTEVYCVADPAVASVGTESDAGKMSPHRLRRSTMTDELRIFNNFKGITVAVALKDRGAVLPAGYTGTAYWFHGKDEGRWVSSTYYMNELPRWVEKFNKSKTASSYRQKWKLLYDKDTYVNSNPDDTPYEQKFKGEKAPVFPHDLPGLWEENGGFDMIKSTPFGNNITTDFALAALEGEGLGEDDVTDFLAISYSSTDYVGHRYGVKAMETEDTYLRLDRDLERLLKSLDEKVGKGEYLVFLTADHGASYNPRYLEDHKMSGGFYKTSEMINGLNDFAQRRFGNAGILRYSGYGQVYLNHSVLDSMELDKEKVRRILADHLLTYDQVEKVFTVDMLRSGDLKTGIAELVQNGYNAKLSGDIFVVFSPGLLSTGYVKGGTSHGTAYVYDTHVPFLLYGKGIRQGYTSDKTVIPDIAPTISSLLGIPFPNGVKGAVRSEAYKINE
ncbi:alkaline phosphatase PafA [Robertkochia flava]|uniref:alkaline phosphatase PafA n=1 Tax=Robertkochia flava TaxID=3447986 RepID=UPI001CCBA996|nr:alkaline phosphatase PafA [Robertkochia marina]